MLSPEELEAIRQRCEAATRGPWRNAGGDPQQITTSDPAWIDARTVDFANVQARLTNASVCFAASPDWEKRWNDAEFVAHARQDIPALLAHIAELEWRILVLEEEGGE